MNEMNNIVNNLTGRCEKSYERLNSLDWNEAFERYLKEEDKYNELEFRYLRKEPVHIYLGDYRQFCDRFAKFLYARYKTTTDNDTIIKSLNKALKDISNMQNEAYVYIVSKEDPETHKLISRKVFFHIRFNKLLETE